MFDKHFREEYLTKVVNRSAYYERFRKLARIKTPSAKDWNPDVTISRDPGSGGKVIASRLAKKLGWELFNKKLLAELARKLGYEESIIRAIDEHPRTKVTDIFHALFNPHYISDYTYIQTLKKLVTAASIDNDVVFLGRGTNHILPEDKSLRVRITSSFENRVRNIMKYEGVSKEIASSHARKTERDRSDFIKQYFGCESNCPEHFDLTINTDYFTPDGAVALIIAAYRRKFPRVKLRTHK